MKERPILFSGPMVRALLAGTKMQTRRVVKPQPRTMPDGFLPRLYWPARDTHMTHDGTGRAFFQFEKRGNYDGQHTASGAFYCPYGQPGDRLWVRENGWERPERTPKMMREGADTWEPYYYDADDLPWQDVEDFRLWGFKRRPSIHMPRWASRITLEITAVRVERLQDISEVDAKAEGLYQDTAGRWTTYSAFEQAREHLNPVQAYRDLWEQINGPGSWDANPWVYVIQFKKV